MALSKVDGLEIRGVGGTEIYAYSYHVPGSVRAACGSQHSTCTVCAVCTLLADATPSIRLRKTLDRAGLAKG